jgi:hypothetical protein
MAPTIPSLEERKGDISPRLLLSFMLGPAPRKVTLATNICKHLLSTVLTCIILSRAAI